MKADTLSRLNLVRSILIIFGGTFLLFQHAGAIQVSSLNPRYWEVKGQPTVLLGASDTDSLFQMPHDQMIHQLDTLVAAGGNYVRNTMGDRGEGRVYAFHQLPDGLYDLDQWNPEYWKRFETMLEETSKRGVIVQIELWDRWNFTTEPWSIHPWNPKNNITFNEDEVKLPSDGSQHYGARSFWKSVPEWHDDPIVRAYQEKYVAKVMSIALRFDNVLYVMTNEQDIEDVAAPWSLYWTKFIKAQAEAAGKSISRSPMFVRANSTIDHLLDNLDHYEFGDMSQTGLEWKQNHADIVIRQRTKLNERPMPLNSVKQYGGIREVVFSPGKSDEGAARGWRTIFCGGATVRYHRPGPSGEYGLGLGQKGQRHLAGLRLITNIVPPWRAQLHQDAVGLLSGRQDDEAYIMVDPEHAYVIYMPHDADFPNREADFKVDVDVSALEGEKRVRWYNIEAAEWGPSFVSDDDLIRLIRPGTAHWVAVITRATHSP